MRYVSESLCMIIVSRFELWCSIILFIGGIGAYFCFVYIHWWRDLPFRGQLSFILQLHDLCILSWSLFRILELCCVIKFFALGIELWLISMVFKLKLLLNLCDLGKCFLRNFRNTLQMFVFTFKLYGRLNHMTFLFLFRLAHSTGASNTVVKPTSF